MDRAEIKQIIQSQGYAPRFMVQEHHSGHRRTPDRHYVLALKGGAKRQLGNFEEIAQMSEEELRSHIVATFATKARRYGGQSSEKAAL